MRHLCDDFEVVLREAPERSLIVVPSTGLAWSASALWCAHLEYMRMFRRSGLRSGDLIVCAIGNRAEFVPIVLAACSLGATVMPLDMAANLVETEAICGKFGAKACLMRAERTSSDASFELLPGDLALSHPKIDPVSYPGLALLKLTSGTTDTARATRTTEAQLIADATHIIAGQRITPGERQIATIPLAHSYGFSVILLPLLLQGTSCVLRDAFVPQQLLSDVRELGVCRFPGVPFMFDYLADHLPSAEWPSTLGHLVSAGAPLTPASIRTFHERFGVKVHSFYGTTETGGIAFDDSEDVDDAGAVGRPIPGVSVALRPMDDLPEDCGRVFVQSAAVSDGYVDGDDSQFADGGFLTGDYASQDSSGRLTLRGRISSFINVAGRKVQPDEVEAVLRTMPGIVDVRVIGNVDVRRGQQVVACVVARPGAAAPTAVEIRRFCATRLAAHKIPRTLVLLDAIPLTSRGKTDRSALQQLVQRVSMTESQKES